MDELDSLQKAVLAKLLGGEHSVLAALRAQAGRARLVSRRYTGVGFFCDFTVSSDVPPLREHLNFQLGDVSAEIAGLQHGAGFVLFVRSGYLSCLEGFSYDEPWPETRGDFQLAYIAADPDRRETECLFQNRSNGGA